MTDPRATADGVFAAILSGEPAPSAPATSAAPAVPAGSDGASPFPTRRELREAERRRSSKPSRRAAQAPRPVVEPRAAPVPQAARAPRAVPVPQSPRVRRAAAASTAAASPSAFVPPAAPAYADARASVPSRAHAHTTRRPVTALLTMTAVAGLVVSAGLPAYAFTQPPASSAAASASVGSALSVPADATSIDATRDPFTATTRADLAAQRSNRLRDANWQAYQKSGAREAGDDYPYFSELSLNQGGGLSPLNYFYRECVDFVAWKLNEDAGSTTAPFLMDWHYLTPLGGNAYQWKYNWEAHGWTVSTTPKKGSVAWFGGHVGYVAAVNDDGTVLIEEYNYQNDHLYGTRTIPATDVAAYLYAPPRPGE
ncbi:CHAP domain-containing protein [Galbitalea sp. SE-J8]|uniref:CHAP domain-containing protein n=1 Tax=Galbitalea sp. SE-J8 TaxID=3054952 RepID=UPI00259CF447|nr:CHAP domain-containing protein [Galbitalea sp. SE-J8]MDM4763725.1 CHAP domain-containing protein [Galbitalea sp. SE-J8]